MIISRTNSRGAGPGVGASNAVTLRSVGKRYSVHIGQGHHNKAAGDFWALRDVSLSIGRGRICGVIGRNGAGKTTLLNIIAGAISPTEGAVDISGRVLGLFNLGVGFHDELTGLENIYLNGSILGASKKEIDARRADIIDFSELGDFIDMPLGAYSQGMRLRLGFSILVNLDSDILVLDEVLAVGDILFQNKCFERLIDFKRAGRTLVVTTQSMELIERLCDSVLLLDHGAAHFEGSAGEAAARYRELLSSQKFFVGLPRSKPPALIENTLKWADHASDWNTRLGGKEVIIDSVRFEDKNGVHTNRIRTRDPLRIRVGFTVRDRVAQPHFGIAIFRKDGVYCYGPNTEFDGYTIPELNKGKGYFELSYGRLMLSPGDYKVSVAVWDKNETVAFDYHYGCYDLIVIGAGAAARGLLNMPLHIDYADLGTRFLYSFVHKRDDEGVDHDVLRERFGQRMEHQDIRVESVRFTDAGGNEKGVFMTNAGASCTIRLGHKKRPAGGLRLWFGIYRDDGVYCQGAAIPLTGCREYRVSFPRLLLLPGAYTASVGVWDPIHQGFLAYHHGTYPFKMVFDKQDHGTVYLDHAWDWKAG